MTVTDLTSRRRQRERAQSCPGCGTAQLCYPHRLEALADSLRSGQRRMEEELLVAASDVQATVAHVLEVLDGITEECLRAPARVGTARKGGESPRVHAKGHPKNHTNPLRGVQ